ncbi:hypothetical protein N7532_009946 [Penicillium argentinense]|uniref:Uncharacterized protein n=1 Tax=Penicillium argentinense TaxID=1131581 RepID=A0A9W9ENU6_9EURO|nr:uncharacterized protein N7532_009946 [Penicillium argentinense]KAJ5085175.1 hypothetical protein N7532_009946 [Penicillium argentinense]
MNPTLMYQRSYYSPGLYCPSGWATVGVAVRDDENSLSKSGILAPASTTTTSEPDYALISPKDFFLSLLEPSETAVLCCPSSYTADLDFGCWTKIPDYKPSSGCNYHIPAKDFLNFVTVTKVIDGETVTTEYMESLTATNPFGEPKTTTFDDEEKATLAGYDSYAIMTMVHKKADFEEAGPTNAAQRMTPGSSTWTGFGTVLGVSVAAMALGAAIIL